MVIECKSNNEQQKNSAYLAELFLRRLKCFELPETGIILQYSYMKIH